MRLATTQPSFDFVGRVRTWATVSLGLVLVAVLGLLVRDLNLSIDFEGGTTFTVENVTADVTPAQVSDRVEAAGGQDVRVQLVTDSRGGQGVLVRMAEVDLDGPVSSDVEDVLADVTGSDQIQETFVGPTWGEEISRRALVALVVFLVVIVAYISARLQWKMAIAALVALTHDLLLTVGVYAWFGFPVSPNTVIALLTILGYSLYDSVVVFDRVEENMTYLGEPGRRTFQQVVNNSQNEVLWRSINTSLTSLLPVGALLLIGSQLLGATTLRDLALALFVGMALGSYSSLFVAGPMLAWWRGREPELASLTDRFAETEEEAVAPAPEAAAASRKPITTEYVRGEGRRKRRGRRN